jgi:aminoglycoside phosphotransferase (APT) family kinase protein
LFIFVRCCLAWCATALRPWTPVFTHSDLQLTHVFVAGDEITGVIDWSEAGQGMPCTTSPS